MIFGATNSPLGNVIDEIRRLAGLGFDYLELCLDPPGADPESLKPVMDDLENALVQTGLTIPVAHLPTFVWLADAYPGVRRVAVEETVKGLDICRHLGVPKAVLHPGYLTGMIRHEPGKGRELALDSLAKVLDAAATRDVTICLENMFPRSGWMYKPEEFAMVLERFPGLMMTLDLGHAAIQAPPDRLRRLIETGGRRIRHLHVSDNTGRDDDHLPVGAGGIDIAGALAALKAAGYDQTMTLEVFSPDSDYLALSLRKVRAMWEEAR